MCDALSGTFMHHDVAHLRHRQRLISTLRVFVFALKNDGARMRDQLTLMRLNADIDAAETRAFLVLPMPLRLADGVLENLLK